MSEDISEFVSSNRLSASFDFPTPAGPIELVADARRRNITCHLFVDAPMNRRTYRARVRWLLNQLPEELLLPARLDLLWERSQRSSAPLSRFRDDLDAARIDSPSGPRGFEFVYVVDLANRFAGPRTFVPALEDVLTSFYEAIARHIRPWQPPAATVPDHEPAVEGPDDPEESKVERKIAQSGQLDGRSFSIFDDGSIEVEAGHGIQHFKDFAELRAAAVAKNGHARLD